MTSPKTYIPEPEALIVHGDPVKATARVRPDGEVEVVQDNGNPLHYYITDETPSLPIVIAEPAPSIQSDPMGTMMSMLIASEEQLVNAKADYERATTDLAFRQKQFDSVKSAYDAMKAALDNGVSG